MSTQEHAKRLTIIDGTAFVYRAYFAAPPLTNSAGQPTGAIFSFTTTLLKLIREEAPEYLAVCFDKGGMSQRDVLYEAYKADRPATPDGISVQFPYVRQIVSALGIPIVEMDDYEADDVVGTLAKRAEAEGFSVLVMTNDKDLLQLISPQIRIYRVSRDGFQIYDAEACKERYGVEPSQIPDYLALTGDSIDQIPGVKGIGEKTVPKLLERFSTIENLFDHLDEVEPRWRTKLEAGRDMARLSKALATLQTDLPIPVSPDDCKAGNVDSERLLALFRELEFNSLVNEIPPAQSGAKAPTKVYHAVTDKKALQQLIERLKAVREYSIDLETTSTNTLEAKIVGVAISVAPNSAAYIPTLCNTLGTPNLLAENDVLEQLRPFLQDAAYQKIGQNIKYDLKVLRQHGFDIGAPLFDTMIASSLLYPASTSHGMDDLALNHLNYKTTPIEELIGKGKNQSTMDQVPLPQITDYACEDADITLRLKEKFASELDEKDLSGIFRNIEMPLIPVLADMELAGIKVDAEYLKQLSAEFELRLETQMERIYEAAGESFNINSPKQLGEILFEKLNLPKNLTRKTKTGYSTDVRVLERLASHHPLPELILEYRTFAKLKSTYTDALLGLINPRTGRIHTSFHQAVARTGRLSSNDPNLQNIPVRTAEGREIRRAFVACDDDHVLIVADYSQIELRILAHLSGDARLREAFQNDQDIHAQSASLIFGLPTAEIDAEMRRKAKTMNYGIIYGIGAYRLSSELQIDFDEAQRLIDNYFETYSGVREYFDHVVAEAEVNGYVTTLMGRRCYVPELAVPERNTKEFGKRVAINAPMQGTAAELIKVVMLRIHDYLKRSKKQTTMLLQVHDELVFEAPRSEQDEVMAEIQHLMETAHRLDVPIKVDIHAGPNWLEAK